MRAPMNPRCFPCTSFSLILSVLLALFAPGAALAGDYAGRQVFPGDALSWERIGGYDVPSLAGGERLNRPGEPALPCIQTHIVLPPGASIVEVKVLSVDGAVVPGAYHVIPATAPAPMSAEAPTDPFIENDEVYGRDADYPGVFVEKLAQWDLDGHDFVTLRLCPIQYNPARNSVFMAREIAFEVVYDAPPGVERQAYNYSPTMRTIRTCKLESLAANPEAVELPAYQHDAGRSLPLADIEYVIISPEKFRLAWDDLVDWLTRKGIPTRMITLDQIYGAYPAPSDPKKIRAFVQDAHVTWGTVYFLLGGDVSYVPYHLSDPSGDSIPNDTFYADYDDDWKVEVYVGRVSADSTQEIATFIDKTIAYQVDPPQDFGHKVFFMGFDLDDSTPSERCKETIAHFHLHPDATLVTEYDSEAGPHKSDSIAYLNDGQNLINHSDHCGWNVIGVGCVKHGELFYHGDFENLVNGDKQGLFYSLGCWSLAYDYNDSIGEAWTLQPGCGGLAFVGNSRYGWYAVGYSDLYSMKYDQKFFEALDSHNYRDYFAGETLGASKNNAYPTNGTDEYVFTELTLMGDPALPLWTDEPQAIFVQHLPAIDAGQQDFAVKVTQNGWDVEGALVCIRKAGEVYRRGLTAVDGFARFQGIEPVFSGWMTVTVTGRNLLTYEGTCIVAGSGPDVHIDLEVEQRSYFLGDKVNYRLEVQNFTRAPQTVSIWTNVNHPFGYQWPPSGYLNGPEVITLTALGADQRVYSGYLQPHFMAGTYTLNAFVGPDPGVIWEDHQRIDVLPP